ncbi:hypothetical protein EDD18DRAFT_1103060 [Armillaria luteobubalina]|uniref:Uncharacterized protein n=1 Tax=Armillaria luteobubalina TaxID=153913 RepID=A0AA39QBC3_9AGAR|nr:hypothetical protein EDD18DRAFT_1103060 [Armillaria luteobubalina]
MADSPSARIHARIDELERELQRLDELPPEATPGTTEKRQNLVAEIQRRINQISSMGILLTAPDRRRGKGGGGGARTARGGRSVSVGTAADPAPGDIVKARVDKLLVVFDANKYPPLTAKDFAKTLVFPDIGNREAMEDLAYERLIRGYKDTCENWSAAIVPLVESRDDWANICNKTSEIQKLDDDMDRLVAMNKFLTDQVSVGACEMYVDYAMRVTETIRYVKIWDTHMGEDDEDEQGNAAGEAPTTGPRKWKIDFLKRSFRAEHPEAQLELENAQKTGEEGQIIEAKNAYNAKLAKHRKNHQHTMAMRRPLALLYDFFGAAVLMDPSWDVTNKGRKRRRSGVFDEMLVYLCRHLPEENFIHVPATRYESAQASLSDVLRIIARPVAQHVEDFLDMYAPVSFGK